MAHSGIDLKSLVSKINAALDRGDVDAWQTRFLIDMRKRIRKYGDRVYLTEKQTNKLFEIVDRDQQTAPTISNRSYGAYQPTQQRRYRYPKIVIAREGRWLIRSVTRIIVLALILLGGAYIYTIWPTSFSFVSGNKGSAGQIGRNQFTVTDGDTIHLVGHVKGTRLVGCNTPETYKPQCAHERELGNRATARLKMLVATGNLELVMVSCACPPGTEGTEECNFGRSCAMLRVDGRDVGQILISEGLAVPFVCGATSCPHTPRPWCG